MTARAVEVEVVVPAELAFDADAGRLPVGVRGKRA